MVGLVCCFAYTLSYDNAGEKGIPLSNVSVVLPAVNPPDVVLEIPEPEDSIREARIKNDWDVLKSIVYGGLIESITSLSVVLSAAGTDASTCKYQYSYDRNRKLSLLV